MTKLHWVVFTALLTASSSPSAEAKRVLTKKVYSQDASDSRGSARILRETNDEQGRRELNDHFWTNVWTAAVADSDSTATVDGKCLLPDGRAVPIGMYHQYGSYGDYEDDCDHYYSSSSSSKGKGKGKSNGKTCAPTGTPTSAPSGPPTQSMMPTESMAPTGSDVPTGSPTDTFLPTSTPTAHPTRLPTTSSPTEGSKGKGKGAMKKSMMGKSSRHKKSMKSKGKSKSSKSSKGHGSYKSGDLPRCADLTAAPTLTPTSTPTVSPTTANYRETCEALLEGRRPGGTVTQQAALFIVLVGTFDDDTDLTPKLEAGLRSMFAIASGCNIPFSMEVDRRMLSGTSDAYSSEPSYVYADPLVLLGMEGTVACETFDVSNSESLTCMMWNTMVYNEGTPIDFRGMTKEYRPDFEAGLESDGAEAVNFIWDYLPLDVFQPTASPTASSAPTLDPDGTAGAGGGAGGGSTAGDGDGDDGDRAVAGIGGGEIDTVSSREGITAGGKIGIAGASLLLLLLLLLLVRRGRRDKDEVRQYEFTDDDEENSNFIDENADGSPDGSPDGSGNTSQKGGGLFGGRGNKDGVENPDGSGAEDGNGGRSSRRGLFGGRFSSRNMDGSDSRNAALIAGGVVGGAAVAGGMAGASRNGRGNSSRGIGVNPDGSVSAIGSGSAYGSASEAYSYRDEYSDMAGRHDRLAHVVGEEDSQYTGNSWGNKSGLRIEPVRSVPEDTFSQPVEVTPAGVSYDEDERLHDIGQTCSSPTCKICESRRRQGSSTKFVRNQKYTPKTETERDYISADTVDL